MELCVWIEDSTPDAHNAYNNLARWTKGDVIEVLPDGSYWGTEPIKHPSWRIIRVPGLTQAEADSLRADELPQTLGGIGQVLRKRHLYIELDALDALEGGIHQAPKQFRTHLNQVDSHAQHGNLKQCIKLKTPVKHL